MTQSVLCETRWNNTDKEKFQKPEYYTDNISSCVNWIQIPKRSHYSSGNPLTSCPFFCLILTQFYVAIINLRSLSGSSSMQLVSPTRPTEINCLLTKQKLLLPSNSSTAPAAKIKHIFQKSLAAARGEWMQWFTNHRSPAFAWKSLKDVECGWAISFEK